MFITYLLFIIIFIHYIICLFIANNTIKLIVFVILSYRQSYLSDQ